MSNYSSSNYQPENPNSSWYKVFNLISNKSVVLDIGCSSGNFGLELIKHKNCIVDGVELDVVDYSKAKSELRNVFNFNIEADDLSEIKNKYDYIYFGDVIEHLVEPVATLKRVSTLLTKGGKILFSIPNMAYIGIRLDLLKGEFEYTETGLLDKTHLHYYTLKEVLRLFHEAGYDIEHIDYVEGGYSSDYVSSELTKIGLTGSKKFFDFCKTPEVSAFQFVGVARPNGRKKMHIEKRKLFSPINGQDEYYHRILGEKDNKIKELVDQIELIKSSKKYKLVEFVSHITHRIKG